MEPSPYWPPWLHGGFSALLIALFLLWRAQVRRRVDSAASTAAHQVTRGALVLVAAGLLVYPILHPRLGPAPRAYLDGGLAGLVAGAGLAVAVAWWRKHRKLPRVLAAWGTGLLLVGFAAYFAFHESWTESRRGARIQAAKEEAWEADRVITEEGARREVERLEAREKRRVSGALVAAGGAAFFLVGVAWLQARVVQKIGEPARKGENVVRTSAALGISLALAIVGMLFMIPRKPAPREPGPSIPGQLREIARAVRDFREKHPDRAYWVADVASLFRMGEFLAEPIAQADGFPVPDPPAKFNRVPILEWKKPSGHVFSVVIEDGEGRPYAEDLDGDGLRFESSRGFAFCAYPERRGATGRFTYLINENEIVWRKDLGGERVTRWPRDPAAEGWKRAE